MGNELGEGKVIEGDLYTVDGELGGDGDEAAHGRYDVGYAHGGESGFALCC